MRALTLRPGSGQDDDGPTRRVGKGARLVRTMATPSPVHHRRLPSHVLRHVRDASAAIECANNTFIYRTKKIPCSCGEWRNLLPSVFAALEAGGDALDATHPHGHVYEFGLFNGDSMRLLRRMRPFANAPTFGFDSFQGLPSVQAGNGSMEKVLWKQGQFRADPRAKLQAELGRSAPLTFVPGFYSESLSRPGLSEQLGMQVAKYVDIDVDLYSSTVQLLDFMFSRGLIKPGTVFGYDDFWSSACHRHAAADEHPLQHGEGLAHAEAARKYGASFLCLAGACRGDAPQCRAFGAIFLVTEVGNPRGEAADGFSMSDEDVHLYKLRSPVCSFLITGRTHA